jgi:hypothetical protein
MTTRVTTATAWTPLGHADYDVLPGKLVRTADGEPLGTITAVLHPEGEAPGSHGPHYVALEADAAGKTGAGAVYLHEIAIREVRADAVMLGLTRSQVEAQGKDAPPAGFD